MIKNYLTTTFRNLWKTRAYSFLNIFGLAVGISAASLIFLWVEDETGYNNFPEKENTYIVKSKQHLDGKTSVSDAVPGLLGPAVKTEIPGVRHTARVAWITSNMFSFGENNIFQSGYYAEPDLMDIFSLEFLEGDKTKAMDQPNKVILTESAAARIFGDQPAYGKMVRVDATENYMVSAVVRDLPKNSTLQFDWLIPFEVYENENQWIRQWQNNVLMTYVSLEPSTDVAQVNEMLDDFAIRRAGDENVTSRYTLYPMERWRLYNSFDSQGHEQEGRMKYVRLFGIIAWVVLVIACINFMNLATARSEKRAKEVGMRKVVGASRASLIRRFLSESLMLAALSAVLSIGLIQLSIGFFNELVEKELVMDLFKSEHLSFLMIVVLICGTLSGIYPAFYLSSFNPITTLKGAMQKAGAAGFIRRGLVVLQYSASITLIICTVIIYQQIQYTKNRELGYERSQVLVTPLHDQMSAHLETIKEQLIATGAIESASVSERRILYIGTYSWNVNWAGKSPGKQVNIYNFRADADLVPTLGMDVVEGRNFRPQMRGDSSSAIVNETFARLIQSDGKVVGKTIYNGGESPFTIVGVVKDFVYNNVYGAAEPLFFWPFEIAPWGQLNVKIKAGADLTKTISQIEQVIRSHNPEFPFDYQFLDQLFDQQFKSESLIQQLAGVFAVLSILISCLGLFGLAAFTAEKRSKEMGIRKVLGASIGSLLGLLSREFMLLVLMACTLSFPAAWWFMSQWLDNYPYHTNMHWWVFTAAGSVALLIALSTVSSQAIKAALANPTRSLREE